MGNEGNRMTGGQTEQIVVSVFRFDPTKDQRPYYQAYTVPVKQQLTLQRLLEYIYAKIDNTLAFRKGKCYQGVCGRCLVKLNGKPVRACSTLLQAGQKVQVDPLKEDKVLKDLVTEL